MLTLKQVVSQIRSEDCFFFQDRSKRCILPCLILPTHRKFLRFAFGGEAYQYRVLPFGLAHSPRTFTKCVDTALAPRYLHTQLHQRLVDSRSIRADDGSTSRCCSRSYESVGVKTKRQEECAFSWVPTTCQKCYILLISQSHGSNSMHLGICDVGKTTCWSSNRASEWGRKEIWVTLNVECLLVPDGLFWVFQKLLIYWDFHAKPSLGFTENSPKKRKYPVSGSCVDKKALLMSEVRGEWVDWLEMIERHQ